MNKTFFNPHSSIIFFRNYLIFGGLCFALLPDIACYILGFAESGEFWTRWLGATLILVSWIYTLAIREKWISFYLLTVNIRIVVCIFMVLSVYLDIAPYPVLAIGIFDLITAAWTYISVKTSPKANPA